MKIRTIAFASVLAAMLTAAPAIATDYVQTKRAGLAFAGKYDGELFTGQFGGFTAKLHFDPEKLDEAKLEVDIQLAGTHTGNDERDSTLVGNDFFNVAKFAQARFVATTFRALGENRYAADGSLTLRGVSKPVTLTFTWTPGERPLLVGSATVKRLDFDVGGGDWADTDTIPNAIAVATKVEFKPAK
ncbi:MAG: YceI family protein [Thermomonas sp.]|uniref:YceI family protein n=1 Tax=Thermomonas sp. TaxID=1971895 RepID=UPI0039E6472E